MLLYFSSTFIHVITVVLKFIGKAQLWVIFIHHKLTKYVKKLTELLHFLRNTLFELISLAND